MPTIDLSLLLPGAIGGSASFMPGAGANPIEKVIGAPAANGVTSSAFGGRFVQLGRRALAAYQGFTSAGVHGAFDVSNPENVDDQEFAKLIAQYGVIPADSDLGHLAVEAGARVFKQRIKFADGQTATIDAIQIGSRRGGADSPEGRARSRRKNITRYRLGTAAWVMRKLHAQQKLGRKLAQLGRQLAPKKMGKKKGKR